MRVSQLSAKSSDRAGFSLLELVVVLCVVGLLVSLLLPAIQSGREAARRTSCSSHLRQIGIAIESYASLWERYPRANDWRVPLLPHLELTAVAAAIVPADPSLTGFERAFSPYRDIADTPIAVFMCPSDPAPLSIRQAPFGGGTANYAGTYSAAPQRDGDNGLMGTADDREFGWLRPADILDGLSHTTMVSEMVRADGHPHRLRSVWQTDRDLSLPNQLESFADLCDSLPPQPQDFGWRGDHAKKGVLWFWCDRGTGLYNHVLPPNRPSCFNLTSVPLGAHTAASFHAGGVNVLFGDGHLQFVNQTIDREAWRDMGSRNNTK